MKALIGLRETAGQIAALYVESLEARPPLRNPNEVLQAWSASPEQLRGLLDAARVETLSANGITFRTDDKAAGSRRFRGAHMFGTKHAFWGEAHARGCELAAVCEAEAPDAPLVWRIVWPWPAAAARQRGEQALEQLCSAAVKLDAAQTIFEEARAEPGRRGQNSRAAARQTIDSIHALFIESRQALLCDVLASMGADPAHPLGREIVDVLHRASRPKQHVESTEAAIAEAQRLMGILLQGLGARVDFGEQATKDAPKWVPGATRDEGLDSPDGERDRDADAGAPPAAAELAHAVAGA